MGWEDHWEIMAYIHVCYDGNEIYIIYIYAYTDIYIIYILYLTIAKCCYIATCIVFCTKHPYL